MPRKYSSTRSNAARKIAASQLPSPCSICGRIVTAEMQWQADHVVPRVIAEAQGWTQTEIDSPSNTAPAHRSCNERAGAKLGNSHRAKPAAVRTVPQVQRPGIGGAHV
ncbi:HNH endonuclease [Arthrobacter sp. KBS0703]|uniref:HNH endonuclease n=1 Tax=Arthrobacter sp. KBS0703 TaxID=1955698 RepID=UPI00098EF75A|nr:HNH endonuclease [Arthrobacter sp. KBS0703]